LRPANNGEIWQSNRQKDFGLPKEMEGKKKNIQKKERRKFLPEFLPVSASFCQRISA
jgi:hypothetical protein